VERSDDVTKLVTRFGDRMLGMLLKQHPAGACDPKYYKVCGCTADGRQKLYNCAGVCTRTQFACI
jgi:hypothetical protein